MTETQRNFLILGALAMLGVIAATSGAFDLATFGVMTILNILFAIAILAFVVQLRTRRAGSIANIPQPWRLLLDVCGVGLVLVFVTGLLYPAWSGWGAFYAVMFFALTAAFIAGIWFCWNQRPYRF